MKRLSGITALLAFMALMDASSVRAEGRQGSAVPTVTPIFSQLLAVSLPQGFKIVFENTNGANYIREATLAEESKNSWTQMITITGAQNLASNPNMSPKKFVEAMGGGFQRACPDSFSGAELSQGKISGNDAYVAALSCGTSPMTAGQTSESVVVAVIKGERDYYTVQWAERGKPSKTPVKLDMNMLAERFKQLAPIHLCPIVPGESPPYPSCIGANTREAAQP
ncbi:MAG: hypothetical protein FWF31_01435 [Desulfobulbus sp.]|nr:hypothetical protein [Desulfobulbus sp.]